MGSDWLLAQWPAPAGIFAGTTLRQAGDFGRQAQSEGIHVARQQLAAQLELPELSWLEQVHGTAVVDISGAPPVSPADASITSQAGIACAVLTADCLPVLFCAVDGSVIGAAHAGWRGLLGGVLENTVSRMRLHTTSRLLAWLGPAIGPDAFEVGTEVRDAFVGMDSSAAVAFRPGRGDRWLADLYALARQRLMAVGIMRGDIHGGDQCTHTGADRFFSYRRDGLASGRMASVIVRREPGSV